MSFRVRTRRSAHFIEPCLPSPMAAVAPKFALGSVTSRPFEVVPCQKKRRLTEKEKEEVEAQVEARERARNPGAMVRVFVEDETDDNGEPRWHTSIASESEGG